MVILNIVWIQEGKPWCWQHEQQLSRLAVAQVMFVPLHADSN